MIGATRDVHHYVCVVVFFLVWVVCVGGLVFIKREVESVLSGGGERMGCLSIGNYHLEKDAEALLCQCSYNVQPFKHQVHSKSIQLHIHQSCL